MLKDFEFLFPELTELYMSSKSIKTGQFL